MGIFIPGRLGMDEGENVLSMVITSDYSGFMLFFFASGKCAKIPLSSYATKQNRRKLLKAYCDKEPLAKLFFLPEETELAIRTSASRMLLVGTAQIAAKATRDSQGVAVVTLKKNQTIASVVPADTLELANPHRYRVPQPARYRCAAPRRGRGRADESAVKRFLLRNAPLRSAILSGS